jgi:CRP/FNR family cyclic AMP-dependent transcriptional regulator
VLVSNSLQISEAQAMATKIKRAAFNAKNFLAKIGSSKTIATYPPKQRIFSQGDPADSIFYIEKGKIQVSVLSKRGKEAVLAILGPGDFFGEGCLNGHPQRMVSVVTMEECSIVRLPRATMLQALHDEPKFSDMFISYLLRRSARAEEDMIDQLFNSSEKRLARLLLLLANFGKEGKIEPLIPPISQEMLAEMIGTTRSRVSSFMNKFRRLGLIDYNGRIQVHMSLLNVVLNDGGLASAEKNTQA